MNHEQQQRRQRQRQRPRIKNTSSSSSSSSSRLSSLIVLRTLWSITLIGAEWIHFQRTVSHCEWPTTKQAEAEAQVFHLLIIADPQLPTSEYSYPGRLAPLRWLSIKIIHQFIRKSWRLLIRNTNPHAIIFLGDLLDGGIATIDQAKFRAYVHRFFHTFPIPPNISNSTTLNHSPRLIYLVGNHDVGLYPSTSRERSQQARQRFINTWPPGALNGHIEWGNHTAIWIDALSLIEEYKRKAAGLLAEGEPEGEVTQFIKQLSGADMLLPKILFTHVPLWRPEGTSCGPLRESKREIHQGLGFNYQNEIPEEPSKMILEKIQPSLIFSGDDHDYCEVVHTLPSTSLANPSPLSIHEISVKSFSMGMGVHQPGYHLLSLSNPARFGRAPDEQTTFHRPCLLPDQIRIYTHVYLPLLVVSLVVLFGGPVYRLVKSSTAAAASRRQAKTNGLPIHHRTHRHRKSLSRTLMFSSHKPTTTTATSSTTISGSISSSECSSSGDEGHNKSDEEPHAPRFISHRARRSASLGLGMGMGIGLGIDHGDGFHSPTMSTTGMLSYHSPVDSGHDDARFSHPSPADPTLAHKFRRSLELASAAAAPGDPVYPPQLPLGRSLSSRFQSVPAIPSSAFSSSSSGLLSCSQRLFLRVLRLLLGRRLAERIRSLLVHARLLAGPSSSSSSSSSAPGSSAADPLANESLLHCRRRRRKGPLQAAAADLLRLLWVILVVYLAILAWFDF
ncbi:hypothetical protein PCASD_24895 [Puccinia coronata f. sp. avenae]|uniref:Calcineurin-like phosphoesterase domain-containing protein n=1 Tax=Puccinia coronata f. sp. avenae TaxID=200324 RepID=A0A2N5SAM9_9BASI|nr:hypothetical protein PCASD_24895 [Puccinia coronata f. sp. avenae]